MSGPTRTQSAPCTPAEQIHAAIRAGREAARQQVQAQLQQAHAMTREQVLTHCNDAHRPRP